MKQRRVAVLGLGYVGLPLAVELGKSNLGPIIGFDINTTKIEQLNKQYDAMGEVSAEQLKQTKITYSADPASLEGADFIIAAVPTPVTQAKQPDLSPVVAASQTIGQHLKPGTIVVFESTVYPGVTEEVCVPILEKESGLQWKKDFFVGYSPERINPGDKEHTIDRIIKIVSGDTPETLEVVAQVYSEVCKAGVHKATSIKVAEAAKVIENIQRDLNIALVNELSLIFERIGISTNEVLAAAGTKWNFHKYTPGLVGGHCIGVDPYYLVYKAEELGYHPQVIAAGRRINDYMAEYIADKTMRLLIQAKKPVYGSKVGVIGLTFKENVNDTRNSKIRDTITALKQLGIEVIGLDPILDQATIERFGVKPVVDLSDLQGVDAIIISSLHQSLQNQTLMDFAQLCAGTPVIVDIKGWYTTQKQNLTNGIYFAL